jgi:hypothetical protein
VILKQTALSNAADLYMHEGELEKANDLYVANLKMDAADRHSLQGIGRIALMKDNNIADSRKDLPVHCHKEPFTGCHL